jgi:hypothetical protein
MKQRALEIVNMAVDGALFFARYKREVRIDASRLFHEVSQLPYRYDSRLPRRNPKWQK